MDKKQLQRFTGISYGHEWTNNNPTRREKGMRSKLPENQGKRGTGVRRAGERDRWLGKDTGVQEHRERERKSRTKLDSWQSGLNNVII